MWSNLNSQTKYSDRYNNRRINNIKNWSRRVKNHQKIAKINRVQRSWDNKVRIYQNLIIQ